MTVQIIIFQGGPPSSFHGHFIRQTPLSGIQFSKNVMFCYSGAFSFWCSEANIVSVPFGGGSNSTGPADLCRQKQQPSTGVWELWTTIYMHVVSDCMFTHECRMECLSLKYAQLPLCSVPRTKPKHERAIRGFCVRCKIKLLFIFQQINCFFKGMEIKQVKITGKIRELCIHNKQNLLPSHSSLGCVQVIARFIIEQVAMKEKVPPFSKIIIYIQYILWDIVLLPCLRSSFLAIVQASIAEDKDRRKWCHAG